MSNPNLTRHVVGVDVGGPRKGFHAIALDDRLITSRLATTCPDELAGWIRHVKPKAVAIDSPCRWAAEGRSRPAERELGQAGMLCFFTPTRVAAVAHQKRFYDWVFQGEALFRALQPDFPIFSGPETLHTDRFCFETFPHAVACALAGHPLLARNKKQDRLQILALQRLDTATLNGMDWIDAALCALSALHVLENRFKSFGDPEAGLILIPDQNS